MLARFLLVQDTVVDATPTASPASMRPERQSGEAGKPSPGSVARMPPPPPAKRLAQGSSSTMDVDALQPPMMARVGPSLDSALTHVVKLHGLHVGWLACSAVCMLRGLHEFACTGGRRWEVDKGGGGRWKSRGRCREWSPWLVVWSPWLVTVAGHPPS